MAEVKRRANTNGGRKSSSARRSSSRKKERDIPRWLHIAFAALITAVLLFISYHLFFKQSIYRFAVCEGIKAYRVCIPDGYEVYGIDVSHHQGKINWERLKEEDSPQAPISFAYIKATEGCNHKDKRFTANWAEAKQNGFIRGAYHYFTETSSGDEQAAMFIRNVKLECGDLPPMVDIEVQPKDKDTFITELKKFILRLEEHYGVKPIIYSYTKFHNRYLDEPFFNGYDMWIAHYYVSNPDISRDWKLWQFSDIGRMPGIKEKTDINVLNGGTEALQKLLIK